MLGQESARRIRDLLAVGFEREMAGIEQPDLGAWHVAPECLRAGGKELASFLPQIASSGGLYWRKYAW